MEYDILERSSSPVKSSPFDNIGENGNLFIQWKVSKLFCTSKSR